MCKLSLMSYCHRECVLKGLEMGVFQSKADWLRQCTPKSKKVIRKVLVS